MERILNGMTVDIVLEVGAAGCATKEHRTSILLQYLGDPHHELTGKTHETIWFPSLN